mmetsp:Transcript_18365/g.59210  ORF Transcript_18365/g.59210 Transcript_18365/m.59210 type:complete len:338 (+) Transcript_18365:219-1232(+)
MVPTALRLPPKFSAMPASGLDRMFICQMIVNEKLAETKEDAEVMLLADLKFFADKRNKRTIPPAAARGDGKISLKIGIDKVDDPKKERRTGNDELWSKPRAKQATLLLKPLADEPRERTIAPAVARRDERTSVKLMVSAIEGRGSDETSSIAPAKRATHLLKLLADEQNETANPPTATRIDEETTVKSRVSEIEGRRTKRRTDEKCSTSAKRIKLDDLREQRCEPDQKVEWHGGPGFGGSGHDYEESKVVKGKWLRKSAAAAAAAAAAGKNEPIAPKEARKPQKFRTIDELRRRKCAPMYKIAWHGGPGFGGPPLEYVKIPGGRFLSAAEYAKREGA